MKLHPLQFVVSRWLLPAVVLLLTACGPSSSTGTVRLAVSSPPSAVTRVIVTSSGPGIPSVTVELAPTGGIWGGMIGNIPAGFDRSFLGQAYDASGTLLYRGQTSSVTIVANQTTAVAITLQDVSPQPPYRNEAPIIDSLVASPTTVTTGGSIQLAAGVHDPNPGDTLTIGWSASFGSFTSTNQLATTWTAPATTGIVALTLTVTDSQSAASSITVQVNVVQAGGEGGAELDIRFNQSPAVAALVASRTRLDVGQSTALSVSASDADGDGLSYTWNADCAGSFSSTSGASTSFVPSALPAGACNNCRVTVVVSDGRGGQNTGTVALCVIASTVNRFPPQIVRSYQSSLRASPGQVVTFEVEANDPQGSALTFAWRADAGAAGTATNQIAMSSRVSWTAPNCAGATGDATVTATVTNAYGLSVERAFVVKGLAACQSTASIFAGLLGSPGSTDGDLLEARFNNPTTLAYDGASRLFVADQYNHAIRQIDVRARRVTTVAGSPGQSGFRDSIGQDALFNVLTIIAYDGFDRLFVGDSLNCVIRQVQITTRQVTTIAGAPGQCGSSDGIGANARFGFPGGMLYEQAGYLLIVDHTFNTLRRINMNTREVTTLAGSPGQNGNVDGIGINARFNSPRGLVEDGRGHYFISDFDGHTIRRVNSATLEVSTLAGSPGRPGISDGVGMDASFNAPAALLFDGTNSLFVGDFANHVIRKVNITTGQVTTLIGASFTSPAGMVIPATGQLLVADTYEHVIWSVPVVN